MQVGVGGGAGTEVVGDRRVLLAGGGGVLQGEAVAGGGEVDDHFSASLARSSTALSSCLGVGLMPCCRSFSSAFCSGVRSTPAFSAIAVPLSTRFAYASCC